MKSQIHDYSFDPVAGTVTLNGFTSVALDRLLVVTNTTFAECMFTFADDAAGLATASDVLPNAFVLTHDMTGMAATDALSIFYDLGPGDPGYIEANTVHIHQGGEELAVNLNLDGAPARAVTPGVQGVSLIGSTGDPVDTEKGGLLVNDVKGGDQVVGGSPGEIVRGQRQAGTYQEFRYAMAPTAATFTPWIDGSAFRSISVQFIAATGVVILQGSNDGATASAHSLMRIDSIGNNVAAFTMTGVQTLAGTLRARYFRISLAAGTYNIAVTLFSEPMDFTGVPTVVLTGTPAIAGLANQQGALTYSENVVNSPTAAGAIGSWFPQTDEADGRFAPTVTQAIIDTADGKSRRSSHTGTGIAAAGVVGHFDDSSPYVPNEDTMARVRVGRLRALYSAIRDGGAIPQDYGAQVTRRQALQVEDVQSGQLGDNPIVQAVPGVQVVALGGPTGDPIDTTAGGINVFAVNQTPEVATDFGLQVVRGLVPGVRFINKFGRNASTVTNDAIWTQSTVFAEPATPEICNVASSDNVADIAGGTGARTILIQGLNENLLEVSETVSLNGTTDVPTKHKYTSINRAFVTSAGSGATAAGTITITTTAAGTPVIGQIAIGTNQTQSTVFTVPAGYTGYFNLPNVTAQNTGANQKLDLGFFVRNPGGVFRLVADWLFISDAGQNFHPKVYGAPLTVVGGSVIMFKCIAADSAFDVVVDYDIWLVANDS